MKDKCNPEWEERFANEDTHKEFISETYRQLIQLNIKDTNNPRHKWAKHRNRCFLEEVIQTVIRHLRTFSASLILTQTQSKSNKVLPHTGHNGHLKICPKINARDVWREENYPALWLEMYKGDPLGRTVLRFLKNKIEKYLQTQQSHAWVYIQRKPTF